MKDLKEKLHQLRKQNAELRAGQSRQLKQLTKLKAVNKDQDAKIELNAEQEIKDLDYIRSLEKQLKHSQFENDKLAKDKKRCAEKLKISQG